MLPGWEPVPPEDCARVIVDRGIESHRIRRFDCDCDSAHCVGGVMYAAICGRMLAVPMAGPGGDIVCLEAEGIGAFDGLMDELGVDPEHPVYADICREFGASLN